METEIILQDVCKTYGKKEALKHIDLQIPAGMFGLLGRNGAGKTTLMKILVGLLPADSGKISIYGVDIKKKKEIRKMVGYLPQEFSMYGSMTAYETMDYLGTLSGLTKKIRRERIPMLLEKVNLGENYRTKVRAMSGGMKRRLGIAQALLNDPKVLVVDEPTAGLDPEERVSPHTVYASLGEEYAKHCVIGMAASKTFSLAGLACGNMIVPDPDNEAKLAAEVARSGAYSNSSFGTLALEVGYEQCEPWLNDLLAYLRENYQYLKDILARHFPQVWVAPLEGTYLAWINFSALGLDDKALADFLEGEAQLYLSHGINYGASGFMRLNLACSKAVLTAALDRLLAAARQRGLA